MINFYYLSVPISCVNVYRKSMFLLKKIAAPFLFPIPLSLLFLLTGLSTLFFTDRRKTGKVLVTVGVLIFALLSFDQISTRIVSPLDQRYGAYSPFPPGDVSDPVKYVVVLGCGHVSDPSLPVTSQLSEASLIRLVEGIRVYRKNPGSKMILSGGKGFDPIPEARVFADAAEALGIRSTDLIMESNSKDTKDQARFIQKIVGSNRFILVTSAFHMPRAMALFRKGGMNPIPAPAGHVVKARRQLSPSQFFPSADSLEKSERAIREYWGIIWAKLRGQI